MLKNLVGLVTGGASGLGRGTVKGLLAENCKIVIFDLPDSKGQELAEELGENVKFIPTDVCNTSEVENALATIKQIHGKLNFVVNCAGISCAYKAYNFVKGLPHQLETFQNVLMNNVGGTFNVIRLAAGLIALNQPDEDGLRGTIINTAGIEAIDGQIGQTAIAAASGAIKSLSIPLAREFGDRGIRVVCICPGVMDTPLNSHIPPKIRLHMGHSCSGPKRFGKPEEFGHLVKFILENSYVNGEYIRLDAGLRLHLG